MKDLPVADPGEPDHRNATRYLIWLARTQAATLAGGVAFGIAWMAAPAFMPAVIGRAVDAIAAGDQGDLSEATAVLIGLGCLQAVAGIMRHRFAVTNWLSAAYRTVQVTVRHATRLGATLTQRVAAGEVVAIGTSDIGQLGNAMDVTARAAGAIFAIVVVTVLLLSVSLPLGLVVVVGVPVLMGIVAVLLRPLHRRSQEYRELTGDLTNRAGDIVAGLRVLRGVGGESVFAARYRERSQEVRAAGVNVARVDSVLKAAQILVPGLFVMLVTWLGARFALDGRISVGELVAFYGYATFLIMPLRNLTEAADRLIRGHVAARRVVRLLQLTPEVTDPEQPLPMPPDGDLHDPESGVHVRAGGVTAIAADNPADAQRIADRLGRYDPDSRVLLGGVPLSKLPVAAVRERILVADNDARLFNGPLHAELGGPRDRLPGALHAASAGDVITALPKGLDTPIVERGREFSGGQQQRLRLARALQADPPVLVLVEPTSAVDAHTEARIAARLAGHRRGRTTVICTTSPLLLDRADYVVHVVSGRAAAEGRHRELLERSPAYRATVGRQP
ncbi:ABC transporter [Virgisporangium aliadipatigenens]|uniref:ABC transporter n=1 Tax=Virgisporangium aliadipatigenens TaxID=741659 RepID=A0A8J3YGF5_9ACTN|nr:ABC transporter ATP-binding protein [Virgisporangium aliadipatigenens]GIJ44734.1 ABC transporter [Virgisporangium aliadipatigenens]